MVCTCTKAELSSVLFNVGCSAGSLFFLSFLLGGSTSWCPDIGDDFCDTFAGGTGVIFCLLVLIGFCVAPCIFDCFISFSQKLSPTYYGFDTHYVVVAADIVGTSEAISNNLNPRGSLSAGLSSRSQQQLNNSSDSDDNQLINSSGRVLGSSLEKKVPILYNSHYNITAAGIENLHPFDSCKYQKIFTFLTDPHDGLYSASQLVCEDKYHRCCSRQDLLQVHSAFYLSMLTSSVQIMKILELPGICLLPASVLYWRVLQPMLYQTHGTVLGVLLALYYGFCINLGGGFHHASAKSGGGFCVYADITLAIKLIRNLQTLQANYRKYHRKDGASAAAMRLFEHENFNRVANAASKVLIVDLDAHQGNGHERDCKDLFEGNENVKVLDAYNGRIYPNDGYAKTRIDFPIVLGFRTDDEYYLNKLQEKMTAVMDGFEPDFVVYNAGTDCLTGDPLGGMSISPQGIAGRDEIVFRMCRQRNVPVLMVLSGGYQQNNARVIFESICNLKRKGYLD